MIIYDFLTNLWRSYEQSFKMTPSHVMVLVMPGPVGHGKVSCQFICQSTHYFVVQPFAKLIMSRLDLRRYLYIIYM